MSEEIIKIEHVSKEYRLGMIGGTTLRDELQRKAAKLRGKEDPTRKITDTKEVIAGEKFLALEDVSITINKGERVGIIGHNGAGKSTLLKLISRITAPSSGSIELNGRIASMLEVGTGFHGELSGRENIYMNGAILGMSKTEIDSKIEDIIDFSECRQFIDTPVKRYSSGMYVKLAFSVAAHLDSEIMIMDEVLAVGDVQFQKKCLDKMSQVSHTEGRTILYVSHNMNTIRELCDRVVVLNQGKVVFDGTVEEGINMYLQTQNDLTKTVFNFEKTPREDRFNEVHVLSVKITNNSSNAFNRGDDICFEMLVKALKPVSNIFVRLEIQYNSGEYVGSTFTDKPFSLDGGKQLKINMCLSTENFAPGKYSCRAILFSKDIAGNEKVHDHVFPALLFETLKKKEDLNWKHRTWGHIYLNPIKVLEAKIDQIEE